MCAARNLKYIYYIMKCHHSSISVPLVVSVQMQCILLALLRSNISTSCATTTTAAVAITIATTAIGIVAAAGVICSS
jgi:hypothetical protein